MNSETAIGFMRRAIELAQGAKDKPGASPIGCVIVLDGGIVGEAYNEVGLRHDPTAHAEIVAMRRACKGLGRDDLRGATLYSTVQQCGMCSVASIWTSIGRTVYGAGRRDVPRMYFEDRHLDVLRQKATFWRRPVRRLSIGQRTTLHETSSPTSRASSVQTESSA